MWRGCVDVIAMRNMANIEIKVIIHEEGKQPEIQLYKPDPKFPWKQEDPMRMLSERKNKARTNDSPKLEKYTFQPHCWTHAHAV